MAVSWFRKRSEPPPARDDRASIRDRAAALLREHRFREAADLLAGDPAALDAPGHAMLAAAWLGCGRSAEAIEAVDHAVALDEGCFEALEVKADIAIGARRFAEAVALLDRALDAKPGHAGCLRRMGVALLGGGNAVAARDLLERVVAGDPADAAAWEALGSARTTLGEPAGALDAWRKVYRLEMAPDAPRVAVAGNYPVVLSQSGRMSEALEAFGELLAVRPDPTAHYTYGMMLLKSGNFEAGWRHHEFRWMTRNFLPLRARFPWPHWSGQSLDGKKIVLVSEQGFGDTLQFIRYAKVLGDLGARVTVLARRELVDLVRTAPGVEAVLDMGDPIPPQDYFAYLMSLPRFLDTRLDTIPCEIPYLAAPTGLTRRWRAELRTSARKVAIVWSGDPRHALDRDRSLAFADMRALATLPDVKLYSLNKSPRSPADDALLRELGIEDLGPRTADFSQTAAILEAMDLVVSVDTAVAHLAGALGRPTWLLVSAHTDYRWFEAREDSPWYPSMRILRRRSGESAAGFIERVAADLREPDAIQRVRPPAPWAPTPVSVPSALADIAIVSDGQLQYLPDEGAEALSLARYGEWKRPQADLALRLVSPDSYVLDVYPGIGAHSVRMAAALDARGHFMAFEPRKLERQVLRNNLAVRGIVDVTLLDDDGTGVPDIDGWRLGRLDVMKIGARADPGAVLRSAQETLWRLRPRIVMEADRSGGGESVLEATGYRLHRFEFPLFEACNIAGCPDDAFPGERYATVVAIPEESPWELPEQ